MFVKEKTLFQTTKYATTKSLHWFDDGQISIIYSGCALDPKNMTAKVILLLFFNI